MIEEIVNDYYDSKMWHSHMVPYATHYFIKLLKKIEHGHKKRKEIVRVYEKEHFVSVCMILATLAKKNIIVGWEDKTGKSYRIYKIYLHKAEDLL